MQVNIFFDDDRGVCAHEDQQYSNIEAAQYVLLQQLGKEHGGQGKVKQVVVEDLCRIEVEKPKPTSEIAEHDHDKERRNNTNQLQQSLNPSCSEFLSAFFPT